MWVISFELGKQPTVVGSIINEEMQDKGLIITSKLGSYEAAEPGFKPRHFDFTTQTLSAVGTKLQ